MKTLFAAAVAALILAPAIAQYGSGSATHDQTYYSKLRPISLTGEVVRMDRLPNGDATVVVQTTYGRRTVILGPEDWYKRQYFTLRRGDRVEISGFITDDGDIAASYVWRGSHKLFLRSEMGVPVWSTTGYATETQHGMMTTATYSMPSAWTSAKKFKSGTPMTITGVVTAISLVPAMHGSPAGVHVDFRTDAGEMYSAHIGPEWAFCDKELTIKTGDRITVRGAQIMYEGKKVLLPAEVSKNGVAVVLRNANGEVIWRNTPTGY